MTTLEGGLILVYEIIPTTKIKKLIVRCVILENVSNIITETKVMQSC
jgi:hypothetical protein